MFFFISYLLGLISLYVNVSNKDAADLHVACRFTDFLCIFLFLHTGWVIMV